MTKDNIRQTRRALRSLVTADEGRIADKYAQRLYETNSEFGSKQEIRNVLESMICDGIVVRREETKGKSTYGNIYLPSYTLCGLPVSLRDMERSERNVHGLSRTAISKRLTAGATPEEALDTAPTAPHNFKKALVKNREFESDDFDFKWK